MNGVTAIAAGLPASTVFRLSPHQPVKSPPHLDSDHVILAGVTYPPRVGGVRPLAALLPDVLAKYGLTNPHQPAITERESLDILA